MIPNNTQFQIIEDFSDGGQLRWETINDVVMGGRSDSHLSISDNHGWFKGTVSLENNGGFASVRSKSHSFHLDNIQAFRICVKGDGQRYHFRVYTSDTDRGVSHTAAFDTENDTWTTHTFSLSDFDPSYRGRTLNNVSPINPAIIEQFGFLIKNKQDGPFKLCIDSISGIRQ